MFASNKLIISQYPTLNVAKLESFKGQTPYELHGNAHCDDAPASTLERLGRETHRRRDGDHSVLPFPGDDGLSTERACAAPEGRQEPGRV